MKVVILAGGFYSNINDDNDRIPKPMVEIGEKPLLWHIMKQFSFWGINDFVICGGYKVDFIKQYFMDYYIYQSDITVDLSSNKVDIHKKKTEDWNVTVVNTGITTSITQRIALIQDYVDDDFIVTYGDCLSNLQINKFVKKHLDSGKIATIAIAKPTGRNEILPLDENGNLLDSSFKQVILDHSWVNACTMIFKKDVFQYIDGNGILENKLFPLLSRKEEITTYKHEGFWSPVETRRDKIQLEMMWEAGEAPWKVW